MSRRFVANGVQGATALALMAWLGATACSRSGGEEPRRYPLEGQVLSVEAETATARVAHEDIPGFMPAMTMPFSVRDPEGLAALRPGDRIRATLVVAEEEAWLERLEIVGHDALPIEDEAPPLREGQPGDLLPDVTLINQDGDEIKLSDFRGRALAITFIFTRCPLPDFCPRMSAHFAELERLLSAAPDLHEETRLLSISFDTAFDTPSVLKEYGHRYLPKAEASDFGHWQFASGSAEQVRELANAVGLDFVADEEQFVHNLRTAIVDGEGRLVKILRGNDWKPEDALQELQTALAAGAS